MISSRLPPDHAQLSWSSAAQNINRPEWTGEGHAGSYQPPAHAVVCCRCCLHFRLPNFESWTLMGAELGSCWSPATAAHGDPPVRTRALLFSQSHVLFACDLELEAFLEACRTQELCIEVHGESAPLVQVSVDLCTHCDHANMRVKFHRFRCPVQCCLIPEYRLAVGLIDIVAVGHTCWVLELYLLGN